MAKATVLMCDQCESWDSADNHVKTVSVAGPRLELCTKCRAAVLVSIGIDEALALRYQQMVDTRNDKAGTWPALSTAESWKPGDESQAGLFPDDGQHPEDLPPLDVETSETDADQGEPVADVSSDSGDPEADTPGKRTPTRRGRTKE